MLSAGTNLCALIGVKLLKRRPAGTETDLDDPKGHRQKQKSDPLPFYLAPISALKTCDNCCS